MFHNLLQEHYFCKLCQDNTESCYVIFNIIVQASVLVVKPQRREQEEVEEKEIQDHRDECCSKPRYSDTAKRA